MRSRKAGITGRHSYPQQSAIHLTCWEEYKVGMHVLNATLSLRNHNQTLGGILQHTSPAARTSPSPCVEKCKLVLKVKPALWFPYCTQKNLNASQLIEPLWGCALHLTPPGINRRCWDDDDDDERKWGGGGMVNKRAEDQKPMRQDALRAKSPRVLINTAYCLCFAIDRG